MSQRVEKPPRSETRARPLPAQYTDAIQRQQAPGPNLHAT